MADRWSIDCDITVIPHVCYYICIHGFVVVHMGSC